MTAQDSYVSVIDPVSPALTRVRTILFRPFDLGKWFIIGFCAWLAYLGEQAGGPNFHFPNGGRGRGLGPREVLEEARVAIVENLPWLIPVGLMVLMLVIGLWLLFTWLSSRGRFMFLHCVAENKAEVKVPWTKFRAQGNSLFLFRIVLGLIGFLAAIIALGLVISLIVFSHATFGFNPVSVVGIIVCVLFLIVVAILFTLVGKFTMDFAVPIMFLRMTSCTQAWGELLELLSVNKLRFLLYVLFRIVIGIAIGAIVIATVCVTCCCAGCILAIPYIGTVALLPILIFERSYSLYYLGQYGSEFDVFRQSTEIAQPA